MLEKHRIVQIYLKVMFLLRALTGVGVVDVSAPGADHNLAGLAALVDADDLSYLGGRRYCARPGAQQQGQRQRRHQRRRRHRALAVTQLSYSTDRS